MQLPVDSATGFAIAVTDLDFRLRHFNADAQRLFGWSETTRRDSALDQRFFSEQVAPAVGKLGSWEGEVPLTGPVEGPPRLRAIVVPWINPKGRMVGYVICWRQRAERSAEDSQSIGTMASRALLVTAPDPIFVLDTKGCVAECNPAAVRVFDRSRDSMVGQFFDDLLEKSSGQNFQLHFERLRNGNSLDSELQISTRHAGVRDIWVKGAPQLDAADKFTGAHLFVRDVTEMKEVERDLRQEAIFDALTELPKPPLFHEKLAQTFAKARQHHGHLFAVLFLDLDHFKKVNDSLGYHAGDELLAGVAQRIRECLRNESVDAACRVGGDEFLLLLDDLSDVTDATRIARQLLEKLDNPFSVVGTEVFVNASVGIAVNSIPYERPENLLRDAETAMYRAKQAGRNRYISFDREMHDAARRRLKLETDLKRALDRQELVLFYQPIVSPHSYELNAFEALIRWKHSEDGMISPGDFIPIAEETGLINDIGRWILGDACRQIAAWRNEFPEHSPVSVHVNLSSRQFNQPDLVEQVETELTKSGIPNELLKLEVTESLLMERPEAAKEALERLDTLGVEIHIDDFGTGYSSLSYLHSFPFGALKIDRSFVSRMRSDKACMEIVRTIVGMSRNIGFETIAEGVETQEQLAALRLLGCDYAQGFYFSRPLPAAEASAFFTRKLGPAS